MLLVLILSLAFAFAFAFNSSARIGDHAAVDEVEVTNIDANHKVNGHEDSDIAAQKGTLKLRVSSLPLSKGIKAQQQREQRIKQRSERLQAAKKLFTRKKKKKQGSNWGYQSTANDSNNNSNRNFDSGAVVGHARKSGGGDAAADARARLAQDQKLIKNKRNPELKQIRLIGERHSGTNFVTRYLKECFPGRVGNVLLNHKHWLQPSPEYVKDAILHHNDGRPFKPLVGVNLPKEVLYSWHDIANAGTASDKLRDAKTEAFKNVHVILLTRDPYDWMEAMRELPYHWIHHMGTIRNTQARIFPFSNQPSKSAKKPVPLDWKTFVTKPLRYTGPLRSDVVQNMKTKKRNDAGGTVSKGEESRSTSTLCQKGYLPDMIEPCQSQLLAREGQGPFMEHDPHYELNPETGEAFEDPLAFRAYKLNMMMQVPNKWDLLGFQIVQYEDLVRDESNANRFIQQLSKILEIDPHCPDPLPVADKEFHHKEIDAEFHQWITDHADWETEAQVGYESRAERK